MTRELDYLVVLSVVVIAALILGKILGYIAAISAGFARIL